MRPGSMVLKGSNPKQLLKLQKLAAAQGDDRFFKLRPIGGLWFVQSLEWGTNSRIIPPLSFTAELRQVYKTGKSKCHP
jgi:hypothetical protein